MLPKIGKSHLLNEEKKTPFYRFLQPKVSLLAGRESGLQLTNTDSQDEKFWGERKKGKAAFPQRDFSLANFYYY